MNTRELLFDELKEYTSLYRFTSLDSLLNILLTNSLVLAKPDLWDDPHEMRFIKEFTDKSINDLSKNYSIAINDYGAVKQLLSMQYMIDTLYAQCWSILPESDALWRIYNYEGKALRLHTKISNIKKHDMLMAVKISYADTTIDSLPATEFDFYKLATTKRTAFSHENEVRLVYNPAIDEDDLYVRFLRLYRSDFLQKKKYLLTPQDEHDLYSPRFLRDRSSTIDDEILKYTYKFDTQKNGMRSYPSTFDVEIKPSNFIHSVLVSPFAPAWFCQMIKALCNEYGIRFDGQSDLYKKSEPPPPFACG